jgi:lipopolysaccharide/colanic/teichoic acid biosynthesis glycosyltransferase
VPARDCYIPAWKRPFDILLVVALSPIVLPASVLTALCIKLVSRGPIFFKQERVGYLGRRFICYKFRTMHPNSDTPEHREYLAGLIATDRAMTKKDNEGDSRLIPLGQLIRASGMDELPQLINVLRGEMSMVGPRPAMPSEYAEYLPWHKNRCAALPGLTGLWQVSGKNETNFSQMVALDIDYARRQSVRLDVSIIFKTFGVLLKQIRQSRKTPKPAAKGPNGSVAKGLNGSKSATEAAKSRNRNH